jgi:hypothetical protein
MGMDLVPIAMKEGADEESAHFHANWSGWSVLASMLDTLGADMSSFSGSNDGEIVPRDVAESWGAVVEENFDNLYVLNIVDDSLSDYAKNRTIILSGTGYDLITWSQHKGDNDEIEVTIRRVADAENLCGFIKHFAKFCQNSGGFAQY